MTWVYVLLGIIGWAFAMVGMFFLVSRIFRLVSGWGRVEQKYGIEEPAYQPDLRGISAGFGFASAKNTMHLGLQKEGLQITITPLFRFFMKPVLIPWNEVGVSTWTNILGRSLRLTFSRVPGGKIDLFPKSTTQVLRYIEQAGDKAHPDLRRIHHEYSVLLSGGRP